MEQKAPVLVFDGDCGFCTACVKWGFKNFSVMPESVAFQLANLDLLGLSRPEVERAVYLVTPEKKLAGHLAVAGLLNMQPQFGWRFLGSIMSFWLYSPLFALGYRLVVRFRHLMPGASDQCRLGPKGL
jgi:predicted DCC family thiol-disulfide oxidoreductase YuxK